MKKNSTTGNIDLQNVNNLTTPGPLTDIQKILHTHLSVAEFITKHLQERYIKWVSLESKYNVVTERIKANVWKRISRTIYIVSHERNSNRQLSLGQVP